MIGQDYVGDHNIKKLAYIGLNALNYLHARKLLHSISSDVDCSDPIETILNADKLAAAISYNEMEPAGIKHSASEDLSDSETSYLLANL